MYVTTSAARFARIVIPAVLATAVVSGQGNQKPVQVPTTQTPVFRGETDYFSTDVRVRDNKGNFVSNLRLDEFEVYEDGVLQKITNFIPIFGGRQMNSSVSAAPVARPTEGLILPKQRATNDTSGRIFIIFIDDLNMQGKDTIPARRVLEQVRDIVRDNDLVGIVSSGYSSIEYDLAYDYGHKRLNEAINKTMNSGMSSKEIIESAQTSEGPAGLRYMAHTAMRTANDIMTKLQAVNDRRKSFIYVSSGYDFDPFKDSRLKHEQELYGASSGLSSDQSSNEDRSQQQTGVDPNQNSSPFTKIGTQFAEADLVSDLAEMIRTANRANVTLYTMDPRGLIAGADINETLSISEFRDHVTTTINSLKAIADNTGGFCACDNNDFKKALERIDNETSDYYIIGYSSSNPDPLKLTRHIEIRINRPGANSWTLHYRPEASLKRTKRK